MRREKLNLRKQHDDAELFLGSVFRRLWARLCLTTYYVDVSDAHSIVRRELGSISSVEVVNGQADDTPPGVEVHKLELSCPYCIEGKHQMLDFGQWEYLFEFSEEDIELLEHELLDLHSRYNVQGYQDYRYCDLKYHDLRDLTYQEIAQGTSFFLSRKAREDGVARRLEAIHEGLLVRQEQKLADFDPAQLRLRLPGFSAERSSIRLQTNLLGLYRCSCCEKSFAVSFSDGRDALPSKANIVLDAIASYIEYDQRRTCVRIESDDGDVAIEALGDPRAYTITFSLETGVVRLNGIPLSDMTIFQAMLSNLSIDIGIFDDLELVREVAHRLPPLPNDVAWTNCRSNMRLLFAANRFIGYPASFYQQLAGNDELFVAVFSLDSGLPRFFEDIEGAYAMTGLPNKKSIRRRLFQDPIKLFKVLQLHGLPFENIDIINAFLDDQNFDQVVDKMIFETSFGRRSLFVWQELARIKGEANVLRFLQKRSNDELRSVANEADILWAFDPWVIGAIEKTSMHDLPKSIPLIRWAYKNPSLNLDESYLYTEEQRRLEGMVDEISFELPSSARDLVMAGAELHNCMGSLPLQMGMHLDRTYLLIKKGKRHLGGVTVEGGRTVIEARGCCNAPIWAEDDLWSVFCEWAKVHELAVSRFVRQDL